MPGHLPGGVRASEHDEEYRGRQLHPGGRKCPAGYYRTGGKFSSTKSYVGPIYVSQCSVTRFFPDSSDSYRLWSGHHMGQAYR